MATREEIWTAADALVEAGERPTLVAVRKQVGGGSYTTISEAMAEWRARQEQPPARRDPAPETIAAQAAEMAAAIWAQASALAHEKLQAERAALDAARETLEQERAEAVDLADVLSSELDQVRADLEAALVRVLERDETIGRQAQEIDRWRQEATEARESAARLQGQVEALERLIAEWRSRMVPVIGSIGD